MMISFKFELSLVYQGSLWLLHGLVLCFLALGIVNQIFGVVFSGVFYVL